MPESFASRRLRWGFNRIPAYRGTGARVTYIAGDYREVRVRLPLSWRTRNYVGTIFGGSLYGAVDPVYMIMLIKILGHGYVVWDKAATIRFRRPGRSTLYARFLLDEDEIRAIRELAEKPRRSTASIESTSWTGRGSSTRASRRRCTYARKTEPPQSPDFAARALFSARIGRPGSPDARPRLTGRTNGPKNLLYKTSRKAVRRAAPVPDTSLP